MWAPAFHFGLGARFGVLRLVLLAMVATALVALGSWAGYSLGRAPLLVQLSDLKQAHAEAERLTANAAARTLSLAQARSDTLTVQLASQQQQVFNLQRAAHASLQQTLFGRHCLSADAVRVLNGTDDSAGIDMPQTSSSTAAARGTFATDADVGHWAIDARSQHEQCRARLDALIDWHTGEAHED